MFLQPLKVFLILLKEKFRPHRKVYDNLVYMVTFCVYICMQHEMYTLISSFCRNTRPYFG